MTGVFHYTVLEQKFKEATKPQLLARERTLHLERGWGLGLVGLKGDPTVSL